MQDPILDTSVLDELRDCLSDDLWSSPLLSGVCVCVCVCVCVWCVCCVVCVCCVCVYVHARACACVVK